MAGRTARTLVGLLALLAIIGGSHLALFVRLTALDASTADVVLDSDTAFASGQAGTSRPLSR